MMGFANRTRTPFSQQEIIASGGFVALFLLQAPVPPDYSQPSVDHCRLLMLLAALVGALVAWFIPDKWKRVE